MTRLVGVRAVCDGCSAAAAIVFCVTHRNVLCADCDRSHHANPQTTAHQRVDLASAVTALPFCEYCDDAPATTYCESEGSTLCDKCDQVVHKVPAPSHSRTPIEKTLRNRSVEFRSNSRLRGAGRPRAPTDHRPSTPPLRKTNCSPSQSRHRPTPASSPIHKPSSESDRDSVANPTQSHAPEPNASNSPPQNKHPVPIQPHPSAHPQPLSLPTYPPFIPIHPVPPHTSGPPVQSTTPKRRPRQIAKRKARREPVHTSQPINNLCPASSDPQQGQIPRPELVQVGDYSPYFNSISAAAYDQKLQQPPTSPLVTLSPDVLHVSQSFNDPLLMDSAVSNTLEYDSIELFPDNVVENLNDTSHGPSDAACALPSASATTLGTTSHDLGASSPQPHLEQRYQKQNIAAVAAAAAAAAGEMYLLKTVSPGSGPSHERSTPPLSDISRAPDPAGVAEAATVAAQSAASAVNLTAQALTNKMASIPTEGVPEAPLSAGRIKVRMKRESDPTQTLSLQRFNEAVQRLEVDGGRGVVKGNEPLCRPVQKAEGQEGSTELAAQISLCDNDVLRPGDMMGDMEFPRGAFESVFGPVDVANFEQNGSGTMGSGGSEFVPFEFRGRSPESDEG